MDNLKLAHLNDLISQSLSRSGCKNFLVGISGGVDSLVLLTIINQIKDINQINIRAIHINHNLSKNSKDMLNCCLDICQRHNIELITREIDNTPTTNIEEYLRLKRYHLIFDSLNDDEALVLGHHLNDQIETFFYRLFRGSSPIGLSSMREISEFNNHIVCRPLLELPKNNIYEYARSVKLRYVEDESNYDLKYQRNYIRNKIIPEIKKEWPGINKVMRHNIALQDIYKKIAEDYCDSLYNQIIINKQLCIKTIKKYPEYLRSIFLKYWVNREMNYDLGRSEINNLLMLLSNKNNDYPKVILKNKKSIVRYNNLFHIVDTKIKAHNKEITWDLKKDILFGDQKILINNLKAKGIYDNLYKKAPITLKNISGKERMMLNNRNHQELRKIFQNKSIPTWERERFILLFSNNELLVAYGDQYMFISSDIR